MLYSNNGDFTCWNMEFSLNRLEKLRRTDYAEGQVTASVSHEEKFNKKILFYFNISLWLVFEVWKFWNLRSCDKLLLFFIHFFMYNFVVLNSCKAIDKLSKWNVLDVITWATPSSVEMQYFKYPIELYIYFSR